MCNMLVFSLHRAFYLDKSNLNPTMAPKAAFIDKVSRHMSRDPNKHGYCVYHEKECMRELGNVGTVQTYCSHGRESTNRFIGITSCFNM